MLPCTQASIAGAAYTVGIHRQLRAIRWLAVAVTSSICFVIAPVGSSGVPLGTIAFEDIVPETGVAAIAFVMHAPALQGTAAAT